MQVTFLVPNRSVSPDWVTDILSKSNEESYDKLTKTSLDNVLGITRKIGNGSFRDKVEWNQAMRTATIPTPTVSKRKGYQLINYDIQP
jgi:hypothetical protein